MMATELLSSKSTPFSSKELFGLFQLKTKGYQLMEVTVSPVSSLRGKMLASVHLPTSCRVMCVLRNSETFVNCDDLFIRAGDKIYVLTDGESQELVQRFFLF